MIASACTSLEAGAFLFKGPSFSDERGWSHEAFSRAGNCIPFAHFPLAQENIIFTKRAGSLRGLHYQLAPVIQAKLVTVLAGKGQFFWLDLRSEDSRVVAHTISLSADGSSLYTPGYCAHGFMALEDETLFSLKMDTPIDLNLRGEISFFAPDVDIRFEGVPLATSLSERDCDAPAFRNRRQS